MSRTSSPLRDTVADRTSPRGDSEPVQEPLNTANTPPSEAVASPSTDQAPVSTAAPALATPLDSWQAVWSPAHTAYYFYNSVTQETTWVNPLEPSPEPQGGPSSANTDSTSETTNTSVPASSSYDVYAAAAAQGIDPALAHLDPSLAASSTTPGAFTYAAKFNARTGAFTRPDGRDPTHLSEYERAKRMSEMYFDVNGWEDDVAQRNLQEDQEAEGKKNKRPTRKDLERFKEQKRQKKLAKTAWLRT